jgi:hypothetical protein
VLEVKTSTESPPEWVDELLATGMLIQVDKFSKFQNTTAVYYQDKLEVVPHWFESLPAPEPAESPVEIPPVGRAAADPAAGRGGLPYLDVTSSNPKPVDGPLSELRSRRRNLPMRGSNAVAVAAVLGHRGAAGMLPPVAAAHPIGLGRPAAVASSARKKPKKQGAKQNKTGAGWGKVCRAPAHWTRGSIPGDLPDT